MPPNHSVAGEGIKAVIKSPRMIVSFKEILVQGVWEHCAEYNIHICACVCIILTARHDPRDDDKQTLNSL